MAKMKTVRYTGFADLRKLSSGDFPEGTFNESWEAEWPGPGSTMRLPADVANYLSERVQDFELLGKDRTRTHSIASHEAFLEVPEELSGMRAFPIEGDQSGEQPSS